jgi:hypothetical protein
MSRQEVISKYSRPQVQIKETKENVRVLRREFYGIKDFISWNGC